MTSFLLEQELLQGLSEEEEDQVLWAGGGSWGW